MHSDLYCLVSRRAVPCRVLLCLVALCCVARLLSIHILFSILLEIVRIEMFRGSADVSDVFFFFFKDFKMAS